MKKLILLLIPLLFLLASCSSSSEDEPEVVQGPLISKMVYQGEDVAWDYKNYDFNFVYDANDRLLRIDREDKVFRKFTYSGDLITEAWYYVFWNGNDYSELEDKFHFEYDSQNRLVRATTMSFEYLFIYSDPGRVDYVIHIFSWSGDNYLYATGDITFDEVTKNILTVTRVNYKNYLDINGNPEAIYPIYRQDLTYDTKKHPCSNIKGFKELALFNLLNMDVTIFTPNFGVSNNLVAVNTYPIDSLPTNNPSQVWDYVYGLTFPSKAKKLSSTDFNLVYYYQTD